MADPYGSNIDERDASSWDNTQFPDRMALAERVRQLRIDTDALVAGVSNASVKAALATGGAALALGGSAVSGAGNITSGGKVSSTNAEFTQGIGLHGEAAPGAKSAKIADPTNLATAITACEDIIDVLELYGFTTA